MPANTDPIFTKVGKISAIAITAANTSSQGGGTIATDIFKAFTADATNGSFVREVRFMATATTANTATTATVARVFVSSITSGATTSADTHLVYEITLASVTADSSTAAAPFYTVPLGFALPAGYTILVTTHAAPAANTAWKAVVIAGDY
jgi:hypothetical protein